MVQRTIFVVTLGLAAALAGCGGSDSSPPGGSPDAGVALDAQPGDGGLEIPPGTVRGRVSVFGRPDSTDVMIGLEDSTFAGPAAADGAFELTGVTPGTYVLTAALDGFETERRSVTVSSGMVTDVEPIILRTGHLVTPSTAIMPIGFPPGTSSFVYLGSFDPLLGSGELHVYEPAGDHTVAAHVTRNGLLPSPNAHFLAYAADLAYLSGLGHLGVFDFATESAWDVRDGVFLGSVAFSPDSGHLIGLADYDGTTGAGRLFTWDTATHALTFLAHGVSAIGLGFSPDGRRVAFYRNLDPANASGDLMIWDRATATTATVALGVAPGGVVFAPDWSAALYRAHVDPSTGIGDLYVRRLADADATLVGDSACATLRPTRSGAQVIFGVACAQDANYNQRGTLHVYDFTRGTDVELAERVFPDQVVLDDGETELAYLHDVPTATPTVGRLGLYDLVGAVGANDLAAQAMNLTFVPDGARLVFMSAVSFVTGRGRLQVADVATRTVRTLAEDVARYPVEVTPDGAQALYLTGLDGNTYSGGTFWAQDLATGAAHVVAEEAAMGHTVSPDGRRIAALARYSNDTATGTLVVYDVGAGTAEEVAGDVNMTSTIFSEDGERLAYLTGFDVAGCSGDLAVWRSGMSALALETGVSCNDFRFAPGDRAMLYQDGARRLQVRYEDEAAARLLETGVDFSSLGEDSRHGLLVYQTASATEPVATVSAWDLAARVKIVLGERVSLPTMGLAAYGERLVFLARYDSARDTGDLVVFDLTARTSTTVGSRVFWAATAFDRELTKVAFLSDYERSTQTGTLRTTGLVGELRPLAIDAYVGFPLVLGERAIAYLSRPPSTPPTWPTGLYLAPLP